MKIINFGRFLLVSVFLLVVGCEGKVIDRSTTANNNVESEIQNLPLKEEATYVGGASCVGCHTKEAEQWENSHHDLAMQQANSKTVLGNFNNSEFYQLGGKNNKPMARFFKKADEFWVEVFNNKGATHQYQVLYTFGVYPLQQYLLDYESGQLQAFSVAWDSRPKTEGGQRWFFLYDVPIAANDPLHWTQHSQNWNRRCAACHSTNYKKGYSELTEEYHPKWTDIDVNCESCHGPGSEHIKWSKGTSALSDNKGFTIELGSKNEWLRDKNKPVAGRIAGQDNKQVEQCATCHSRRSEIAEPVAGRFHDWLLLQTLEPDYYWVDGQVRDEVFVTGSFMQSKMYQSGVVCTDCHNPHSLKLKVEGDGVCLQCHSAEKYNVNSHHHHEGFEQGSACVDCHMPETTYMGVDNRRDHKFFIPNPKVTEVSGAPNACNRCHTKESAQWAAKYLDQWEMPPDNIEESTYIFSQAFVGDVTSVNGLLDLYKKESTSNFLKASILRLLNNYSGAFDPQSIIAREVLSSDPMVRREAAALLVMLPNNERLHWISLLDDPFYVVRNEALQAFASVPQAWEMQSYKKVENEYLAGAKYHNDEPGTFANLAGYWLKKGVFNQAETNYKKSLQLNPDFYFALINSADLYRIMGEEEKSVAQLKKAIQVQPNNGQAYFALGLSYVRQQQKERGLSYLKKAVEVEQQEQYKAHYIYVYSVGLWDLGKRQEAIAQLSAAVKQYNYQPLVEQLGRYRQQMNQ